MNIINKKDEIDHFRGKEYLKNDIKMKKMEDDFKNLINQKDEIIKNMKDELLKQKQIIKEQSEKIEILFQMMNDANNLNNKLNKSINYEMEISSMDEEIKDLKGIGFELKALNEFNFDNYFTCDKNLMHDKFIFSLCQQKNDKIPIKELVTKVFLKYKQKGLELRFKEDEENLSFIDFYTDIDFFSRLNDENYNAKDTKKDSENEKNNKDKENNKNNNFDIFDKIKVKEIFKNSKYLFYLKINLKTNFLFKFVIEEDKEKIAKNLLYFILNANYDINTKNFLSFFFEALMEENQENKGEDKDKKKENNKILSKFKGLIINIPFNKIKYDLTDSNKKEIHDFIIESYNKEEFQELKKVYNSEEWLEDLINKNICEDKNKEKLKEVLELFYKIIDFKELSFAFGYTNNKLGIQIKFHLPEEKKINFIIIFIIFVLFFEIIKNI